MLELVGGARFVLLGEASHGTHEFHDLRAEITRRLIEEKGFTAVAVEADWPDAYGTVTAADDWGDPPRLHRVRPALPGSYEHLLHSAAITSAGIAPSV